MAAIVRITLITSILAVLVLLGYWRISVDLKQREIQELQALNQQMQSQLEARAAMIARLDRAKRIAHIQILDQRKDSSGQITETDLLFVELDDAGSEIARQAITIPGNVLYIDAWTVKFKQEDVAEGHPLRGRTLVLLRRIYSDRLAPIDGIEIDTPGAVPSAYAVSEFAEFQQQLWKHFWDIATDRELAANMGVKVAQGEAVYKPVRTGEVLELIVDAAGGMNLSQYVDENAAVRHVDAQTHN